MTCRDAMSAYFRIANIGFKGHMTSWCHSKYQNYLTWWLSLKWQWQCTSRTGLGKWKRSFRWGCWQAGWVISTMQAHHARSAQIQENSSHLTGLRRLMKQPIMRCERLSMRDVWPRRLVSSGQMLGCCMRSGLNRQCLDEGQGEKSWSGVGYTWGHQNWWIEIFIVL